VNTRNSSQVGSRPTPAEAKAALRNELRRNVRIIAAILAVLWLVGLVDWLAFGGRLETFGVVPRTSRGLLGILFAPFLHTGFSHLLANTVAFLLFGGLVLFRQERDFWIVTGIGALFSGVGTWLVGHTGVHVGASGVIFAYFGYLLLTGWFERRILSLILSPGLPRLVANSLWSNAESARHLMGGTPVWLVWWDACRPSTGTSRPRPGRGLTSA